MFFISKLILAQIIADKITALCKESIESILKHFHRVALLQSVKQNYQRKSICFNIENTFIYHYLFSNCQIIV